MKHLLIPLETGKMGHIWAGPTRLIRGPLELVRCAEEIPTDGYRVAYDVSCPDFDTPNEDRLAYAIPLLLADLERGHRSLYVGCMGGIGRTGTILSILVAQHPAFTPKAAIDYVRQYYNGHAVETKEQKALVERTHAVFSMWEPEELFPPEEAPQPSRFPRLRRLLGMG